MDAMTNATLRARDYARFGLEMPKEAARLLEIIEATQAACHVSPLDGINYDKLTAANVTKALREAALTRAVKAGMQELANDVGNQLGRRANDAFVADDARLVAELRPRFLEAAGVVTDALANGLTRDVYSDARRVMNAGPAAAGLFHATRDALAVLGQIHAFLRNGRLPQVATILTLTERAELYTLDTAQQNLTGVGADDRLLDVYALPGVTPALNNAEETAAITARAAALGEADRAAREAAARAEAMTRAQAWHRLAALAG